MSKFECEINTLLKVIENQDKKVYELESKIESLEKNRIVLNRAYAKKVGLLVSNKIDYEIEGELMYFLIDKINNKCFCCGDKDFKKICKECNDASLGDSA